MVAADGSTHAQVFDVESYIADVTPFFAANDFHEVEIAHRLERFGNIAHLWSLHPHIS